MNQEEALVAAMGLLEDGGFTCVIIRDDAGACIDGSTAITSAQRGVRPLIELLDEGADVRGWLAADKVVGNGAAFLYVLLGVRAVYAKVMSESARNTLAYHGVSATCDQLVEQIQNRAKDGLCPMEQAVKHVAADQPQEALAALRAKMKELAGR